MWAAFGASCWVDAAAMVVSRMSCVRGAYVLCVEAGAHTVHACTLVTTSIGPVAGQTQAAQQERLMQLLGGLQVFTWGGL